ncbi:MAG: VanW family protein [Clostridia bacterium]
MKKVIIPIVLCVIFSCTIFNIGVVYAYGNEKILFHYGDKVFCYTLDNNIKVSTQFDQNYIINKYKRFGNTLERQALLQHMIKIGIDDNIAIEYLFPNISKTIHKMEKIINQSPTDAKLKINSNSEIVFFITPEKYGTQIDNQKLYRILIKKYLANESLDIEIPITKLAPKIFMNDLSKFSHLRGEYSTDISLSNEDRKHNIKNAMHTLNKIEIYPNEIFSFNNTVGRRTAENGYKEAKIIVNNEFVEGIGGGVCQVSSTLYNTALLSGMEIIEANKHSKQVHYVKYGFDAMVNFGTSDLKFRNNTNEKITIITNYSPTTIRIRLFGQDLGNTSYKLTNDVSNIVQPSEEIYVDTDLKYTDKVLFDDEYFYLKNANVGMDIVSYREKYTGDKLVQKELLRKDKYLVQNSIKIYGTKKRTTASD